MTLPRPLKAVVEFFLALPSTQGKTSAPCVRAPGDQIIPHEGFCWECHQFVRTLPTTCRDKCCEGIEFYESHYGRHFASPLCPASGTRVAPDAKLVGNNIADSPRHVATPVPRKSDMYALMGTGDYVRPNHERARICNMRWANTTVLLGDSDFLRCRFFNCKLIDDGPFFMENCYTENCTIQSRGSHEKTSSSVRSLR